MLYADKKFKSYISKNLNRPAITQEISKWIGSPADSYSAQLAHWVSGELARNKNTYPT